MGLSASHRLTGRATRGLMSALVVATLTTGVACSDKEKDEPQGNNTGETVPNPPTSVEDTRTTLGG